MQDTQRKPIPGEIGGTLIRRWIGFVRTKNPAIIGSQILCACSGGSDSTGLTQLLTKYGRRLGRVVAILHFNHGWRGAESDADEQAVVELGQRLGIPVRVGRAQTGRGTGGESPEAAARWERKRFFEQACLDHGAGARIFTGHHADDLAETVLWRLMTGASLSHGAGIQVEDGVEVRPALTTRREELRDFLKEEGVSWREDASNSDPRLLRARIRMTVGPELDALFPRWVEHLGRAALELQSSGSKRGPADLSILSALLGNAGIRARRVHWETLREARELRQTRALDLEGGWKLTHEWQDHSGKSRWILE